MPVGRDVLDRELRSSLAGWVNTRLPPRRLGWITTQQRPTCPAFPQVCQGGHVHKGRSRFGTRRQSVSVMPLTLQVEPGQLIADPPPHQTADTSPSRQPTQREADTAEGGLDRGADEEVVAAAAQNEGGEEDGQHQESSLSSLHLVLSFTQQPTPPPPPIPFAAPVAPLSRHVSS